MSFILMSFKIFLINSSHHTFARLNEIDIAVKQESQLISENIKNVSAIIYCKNNGTDAYQN